MNLAVHLLIPLLCCASAAYATGNDKVCYVKLQKSPETFVSKDAKGNEKEFQLFLSKRPIGEGTFGKVYHMHPKDLVDFDGKKVEQPCVALKELKKERDNDNLDNEVRILEEFAKLEDDQRQHLIKLYQSGKIKSSANKAYIMELGEQSLADYFFNNAAKLTDDEIRKATKDIGLAIREFHRVSMHLDLKPDNMMYFRDSGGEKILKAIDFGSSKLLSITVADRKFASYGPKHRANFCRKISDVVGTVRYNSPEIRYNNMRLNEDVSWERSAKLSSNTHIVLTPKSDIWSIGIMIYEAILWSTLAQTDLQFFYELRGSMTIKKIIYELNYMYKYDKEKWIAKRGESIKKEKRQNIYYQNKNLSDAQKSSRDYAAYIYLMLKVRFKHPFLYKLINSCLVLEPKNRPSAVGLVEYLDGECQLQPIKEHSTTPILLDPETINIIGQTLGEKKNQIEVKIMPQLREELAKLEEVKLEEELDNLHNTEKKIELVEKRIENRKRQLQEIKYMEDLFGQNASFDLRSIIMDDAFHEQQEQEPQRWCNTQSSELPQYKKEGKDTQDLSVIKSTILDGILGQQKMSRSVSTIINRTKIGTAPEQQKMGRSISVAAHFKHKVGIAGLREY